MRWRLSPAGVRVRPAGAPQKARTAVLIAMAVAVALGEVHAVLAAPTVTPLYSAGVALDTEGRLVRLAPKAPQDLLFPGTRVLRTADPRSAALAEQQRQWLASGTVPGGTGPIGDMVAEALLDLHTLLQPNGAMIASWAAQPWRYVWPRDASFAAVALARTGHPDDALRILEFLQRVQPTDGLFQARYLPDGSGVPDQRGVETDEVGWVLWAAQQLIESQPVSARPELRFALRPMIDRSTAALLTLTERGLPPASLDYWEIHDKKLSLGTAAPVAVGLRSAAELEQQIGDAALAGRVRQRADLVEARIRSRFGTAGYPRYLGGTDQDASIAFLLPPFTTTVDRSVLASWRNASARMARPGGGLAPGAEWPGSLSWTPQTALFALTAASTGDRTLARQRLAWLATHRTTQGALPEKVLSDGYPTGPAPLAWTGALAVLTAVTLEAAG